MCDGFACFVFAIGRDSVFKVELRPESFDTSITLADLFAALANKSS